MDTRLLSTSYTFISISIRETRKEHLYSCLYKCAPRCYSCWQHYHSITAGIKYSQFSTKNVITIFVNIRKPGISRRQLQNHYYTIFLSLLRKQKILFQQCLCPESLNESYKTYFLNPELTPTMQCCSCSPNRKKGTKTTLTTLTGIIPTPV